MTIYKKQVPLGLVAIIYESRPNVTSDAAALAIKSKYGKNALLKGMNLEEGATAIERNGKIGGHNA